MNSVIHSIPATHIQTAPSRGGGNSQRGRGRGRDYGRGGTNRSDVHLNLPKPGLTLRAESKESIASDRSLSSNRGKTTNHSAVDNTELDGFRYPSHYARQVNRRNRRKVIAGNASQQCNLFKGGPEPTRDLFIYRVNKDVPVEAIQSHLTDNGVNVSKLDCVSHAEAQFRSFRLTVPKSEFNELFDPALWPSGVHVRQYVSRKTRLTNWDDWDE